MKTSITKFKHLILGLGVICTFSATAKAADDDKPLGLFIEPSITAEAGDTSTTYPAPFSDSSGRVEGYGIGARLGFHLNEAFFLGFDGRYSMPQFKDSNVNYDAKAIATNWGPVVGLQMPDVGLRVWGSYVTNADLNPEEDQGYDVKYQDGAGYRVGLGFRLASISLNLEYQEIRYGKTTNEKPGPFSPGTSFSNVNLEKKSWVASVSFPFAM